MANINKIQLSGNVYDIEDVNATKTIELTQAEYDALAEIDPNAFYVISDAEGVDLSNYYTKTEVDSALNGKADSSTVTSLNNVVTAHTADTTIHVTAAEKTSWNGAVTDVATVSASTAANTAALGGLKLVNLTQAEYDELETIDNSTLYIITN